MEEESLEGMLEEEEDDELIVCKMIEYECLGFEILAAVD